MLAERINYVVVLQRTTTTDPLLRARAELAPHTRLFLSGRCLGAGHSDWGSASAAKMEKPPLGLALRVCA